jgi:hypothetical protein
MMYVPMRSLLRAFLPDGSRKGVLAMLQCYFDDSGTHDGSRFVVWGGIMGTEERYEALDEPWRKRLAVPLPGKPPLRQFHLAHCKLGIKEFETYSFPEREHLRNLSGRSLSMPSLRWSRTR